VTARLLLITPTFAAVPVLEHTAHRKAVARREAPFGRRVICHFPHPAFRSRRGGARGGEAMFDARASAGAAAAAGTSPASVQAQIAELTAPLL
jgi:hypothetical protein